MKCINCGWIGEYVYMDKAYYIVSGVCLGHMVASDVDKVELRIIDCCPKCKGNCFEIDPVEHSIHEVWNNLWLALNLHINQKQLPPHNPNCHENI